MAVEEEIDFESILKAFRGQRAEQAIRPPTDPIFGQSQSVQPNLQELVEPPVAPGEPLQTPIPPKPTRRKARDGVTQLGVRAVLEERPGIAGTTPFTEGQKALMRAVPEVLLGQGVRAGATAIPRLAAHAGVPKLINSLARNVGLARLAFPKTFRSVTVGTGEGLGSLTFEPFDPSENPTLRALTTAAFGGAFERIFTPAVVRSSTRLKRGGEDIFGPLVPSGRKAVETILRDPTGTSTPGIFSTNGGLRLVESLVSGSFFGGRIAEGRETGRMIMERHADQFVRQYGRFTGGLDEATARVGKEAVQNLAVDISEEGGAAFASRGAQLYGHVDEIVRQSSRTTTGKFARTGAGGIGVDMTPYVEFLERQARKPGATGARTLLEEWRIYKKLNSLSDEINTIPFQDASDVRSDSLGLTRDIDSIFPGKIAGQAKTISKIVDGAMSKAAQKLNPAAHDAWRKANAFWSGSDVPEELVKAGEPGGKALFDSEVVRSLIRMNKQGPNAVMNSMRRDPRRIRTLRKVIQETAAGRVDPGNLGPVAKDFADDGIDAWNEIQGEILSDMASKSFSPGEALKEFSAKKFLNQMDRFGQEALEAAFSPAEITTMRNIFEELAVAETGRRASKSIVLQLQTPGSVGQALGIVFGVSTGNIFGPGAVILGPPAAARVFTNRKFFEWATIGNSKPPTSEAAVSAWNSMVAMMLAEGGHLTSGNEGFVDQPEGEGITLPPTSPDIQIPGVDTGTGP